MRDVANALIIVNDSYVTETLMPRLLSLCTDGTTSMTNISSHTLGKDLNGLYVQLQ